MQCWCHRLPNCLAVVRLCFFFFNDTATTEIYTLSLHDALPILLRQAVTSTFSYTNPVYGLEQPSATVSASDSRSEEHTSELQSQSNLVCRLLLEKKKQSLTERNRVPRDAVGGQSARAPILRTEA